MKVRQVGVTSDERATYAILLALRLNDANMRPAPIRVDPISVHAKKHQFRNVLRLLKTFATHTLPEDSRKPIRLPCASSLWIQRSMSKSRQYKGAGWKDAPP